MLLVSAGACTSEKKDREPDADGFIVSVGEKAPDVKVKMVNGDSVSISDFKGKYVLLQFMASWCRVCREEIPYIEKDIWQKHKDNDDFTILAVSIDDESERVEPFVKEMRITYPVATDSNLKAFYKYAGEEAGVTRNIFIGKDGTILYTTRLFEQVKFAEFVKFIDKTLAEDKD